MSNRTVVWPYTSKDLFDRNSTLIERAQMPKPSRASRKPSESDDVWSRVSELTQKHMGGAGEEEQRGTMSPEDLEMMENGGRLPESMLAAPDSTADELPSRDPAGQLGFRVTPDGHVNFEHTGGGNPAFYPEGLNDIWERYFMKEMRGDRKEIGPEERKAIEQYIQERLKQQVPQSNKPEKVLVASQGPQSPWSALG